MQSLHVAISQWCSSSTTMARTRTGPSRKEKASKRRSPRRSQPAAAQATIRRAYGDGPVGARVRWPPPRTAPAAAWSGTMWLVPCVSVWTVRSTDHWSDVIARVRAGWCSVHASDRWWSDENGGQSVWGKLWTDKGIIVHGFAFCWGRQAGRQALDPTRVTRCKAWYRRMYLGAKAKGRQLHASKLQPVPTWPVSLSTVPTFGAYTVATTACLWLCESKGRLCASTDREAGPKGEEVRVPYPQPHIVFQVRSHITWGRSGCAAWPCEPRSGKKIRTVPNRVTRSVDLLRWLLQVQGWMPARACLLPLILPCRFPPQRNRLIWAWS